MARAEDGAHAAFFYGALMAPEVFFTVCYRFATAEDAAMLKSLHKFQPAVLQGYRRRRAQYGDYPGITPDPHHEVRGMYVTGLTDANMHDLNTFEGEDYVRKTVKVRLLTEVGDDKGSGNVEGEEVECEMYVFLEKSSLEDSEWDFEEFRMQKMHEALDERGLWFY
jgi:hypothetical protein